MKSKVYSVKELVELNILDKPLDGNHGGIHPKGDDFKTEGIPFIMASDIKNGELDLVNCKFITYEQAELLKKGKAKENDVLITHKATIGRTAIVPPIPYPYIVLSPQVTYYRILKNDVLSPYYLYTYFNNLHFQSLINNWAGGGSTRLYIGVTAQLKLPIEVPNIHEQKKMTKILTYLDKKIKLNNSVVKNLEEISQTLFKQWFINFEFPNEQGEPYKSSGGEMVESELGEIPKGWKAGCIREICKLVKDKVNLDKMNEVFNYIGLEHMPQGSIALANWESSEKVSGNKGLFKKDDILFGKLRPYFKKVGIPSINGVCSTDILIFNSKQSFEKSYLLLNLIQDRFIEYATNTATGTRMPRSGWKQISSYKIVIPDKITLSKFEEIILPMLKKIQDITHENLYLEKLLDTLLPKLLSGEIEISDELVVD